MRALITGGAGFVGSHLCERLLEQGDEVHVLDGLSTGSMRNIRRFTDRDGFDYTIGTTSDELTVARLVDDVDVVYDLAAAVGVRLIVDSPVRTIENNVHGTEVVLEQAARRGKPVFIASSSEVYGKSRELPYREDGDMMLGPTTTGRWSYACGKALGEFLALAYARERGAPVVIGRLFNTVGPRQVGSFGMVIPSLVGQAVRGEALTVFGTGEQRRCFCHVRDVTRAMADLMRREDLYGQVFNIGSDREVSILELAERVRVAADSDSSVELIPYEQAYEPGFEDMNRRIPDIGKIERLLGWRPSISLDDILADVVAEHAQAAEAQAAV